MERRELMESLGFLALLITTYTQKTMI